MQLNNYFEQLSFENGKKINTSRNISIDYSNSLHWHPFVEILVSLSEQNEVSVNFTEYRLSTNDIIIIYPGDLHSINYHKENTFLVIQFPAELIGILNELNSISSLLSQYPYIKYNPFESDSDMRIHLLKRIVDLEEGNKNFKEVEMYSHLLLFFSHLGQYCLQNEESNPKTCSNFHANSTKLMAEACLYISENCRQDLTLEEVSHQLGISKSHFSHMFKHYTHTTFVDFLTGERIKHAETLFTDSSMRITDIAFESGFSSISSFNRAFKKIKGIAPSDFRATMKHLN